MKTRWEKIKEGGPDALIEALNQDSCYVLICRICDYYVRGECPMGFSVIHCEKGIKEYLNQEVDHE